MYFLMNCEHEEKTFIVFIGSTDGSFGSLIEAQMFEFRHGDPQSVDFVYIFDAFF